MINYGEWLILKCIDMFRGERTVSAILHILNGKRSAQTIQDSKLYSIEKIFSTLKINRHQLEEMIQSLLQKQLITEKKTQIFVISPLGHSYLHTYKLPIHLDGFRYFSQTTVFWQRLSLIVQTVSHLTYKTSFTPIQRNEEIISFVKQFLVKSSLQQLNKRLFAELQEILMKIGEPYVSVFVLKLTSAKRTGWTNEQIANFLNEDVYRVEHFHISAIHYMLKETVICQEKYEILYALQKDLINETNMTISTQKTYHLLLKGYALDDISVIRNLKRNTIEDHLMEIVANTNMSIDAFVNIEKQQMIRHIIEKLHTKKLKEIKDHVDTSISYFDIRLVFAKGVENNGENSKASIWT